MFGKKFVVTSIIGIASLALPAFSQSESPEKNEVSVQAFGSFVKSTTDSGIRNSATNSGGVLAVIATFSTSITAWKPITAIRSTRRATDRAPEDWG